MERYTGGEAVSSIITQTGIPRSTVYAWIKAYQGKHYSKQIFGADKITAVMREEGYPVSPEMVRELMRDMGLISIRQDAKSLYDKVKRRCKNYLTQQFTAKDPNEIWVSDVTYFRSNDKKFYSCAIIDLYARAVIGFRAGLNSSTQLVKSTFKLAYEYRKPTGQLLFHTDMEANYRSKTFCDYLLSLNIKQSYSKGGCSI